MDLRRADPLEPAACRYRSTPTSLRRRDAFTRQVELRNVMAVLPGRSPRRIYITGHYDSVNLGAGGQSGAQRRPAAPQTSQARDDLEMPTTPKRRAPTTTAAARC